MRHDGRITPRVLCIKSNASIGAHAHRETFVEPAIVSVAVKQRFAEMIQCGTLSDVSLIGFIVQR